jgi:chemotaxis protein CheC
MANMLKRSLSISLPEVIRGDGARLFTLPQEQPEEGLVLFLYINFSIRNRDIRGYIAMLMDLPSLASLKELIASFIERVIGDEA